MADWFQLVFEVVAKAFAVILLFVVLAAVVVGGLIGYFIGAV